MKYFIPLTALVLITACSSNKSTVPPVTSTTHPATGATSSPSPTSFVGGTFATNNSVATIGSTIDHLNGDRNPYGLAVSPISAGSLHAGDLVVCNFSNSTPNDQGHGTTIEVLHPTVGATPTRFAQSSSLEGCDALALSAAGNPWAAAYTANDNPVLSTAGAIVNALAAGATGSFAWTGPWGQAYANVASPVGGTGKTAQFYESNANDGSIVRINIPGPFTYQKIVTGLSVNHGALGSILAPAGLTYNQSTDTLYVVDSYADRVLAFSHVSQIPEGGITASGTGFTGPYAASARVVYSGAPLNAPISSAQLANGDLLVANTGNNTIYEISTTGTIVGHAVVDTGAAGAVFGLATTYTGGKQLIYFNDDNDNTVKVIQPHTTITTPYTSYPTPPPV